MFVRGNSGGVFRLHLHPARALPHPSAIGEHFEACPRRRWSDANCLGHIPGKTPHLTHIDGQTSAHSTPRGSTRGWRVGKMIRVAECERVLPFSRLEIDVPTKVHAVMPELYDAKPSAGLRKCCKRGSFPRHFEPGLPPTRSCEARRLRWNRFGGMETKDRSTRRLLPASKHYWQSPGAAFAVFVVLLAQFFETSRVIKVRPLALSPKHLPNRCRPT